MDRISSTLSSFVIVKEFQPLANKKGHGTLPYPWPTGTQRAADQRKRPRARVLPWPSKVKEPGR
jgi:hypothetical protein